MSRASSAVVRRHDYVRSGIGAAYATEVERGSDLA